MNPAMLLRRARIAWVACSLHAALVGPLHAAEEPATGASPAPASTVLVPLAPVGRTNDVSFHREILPLLRGNCLPCHNQTTTKGDLSLETPAAMRKGGETGPALVPGHAADSLLLKVATHAAKPRMPPKENKVKAVDLTPAELGLLALWIDRGAPDDAAEEAPIPWQSIAPEFASSFATAVTPDGEFAAVGRANQIHWYHLPTTSFRGRLEDPGVGVGTAQRDVVNALAFSPDGQWLAAGGFREVRLWERRPSQPSPWSEFDSVSTTAASPDGTWIVLGRSGQGLTVLRTRDAGVVTNLPASDPLPQLLAFTSDSHQLAGVDAVGRLRLWDLTHGTLLAEHALGGPAQALTFFDANRQIAVSLAATTRVARLQLTTNSPPALVAAGDLPASGPEITALVDGASFGKSLVLANAAGELRLWAGETNLVPAAFTVGAAVTTLSVTADPARLFIATAQKGSQLWDLVPAPALLREVAGDPGLVRAAARAEQRLTLARQDLEFQQAALPRAEEEAKKSLEALGKAHERFVAQAKALAEKETALAAQEKSRATTEKERDGFAATLKEAQQKLEAARRAADDAKRAAREATERDAALEELAKRAFAAGEAQSAASRAEAELGPKLKDAEARLTDLGKSLNDLKSQTDKARIQRDTGAADVQLAQRTLDRTQATALTTRALLRRAELALVEAEADAKTSTTTRDAAGRHGHRWAAITPAGNAWMTADDALRLMVWSAPAGVSQAVLPLPEEARVVAALGSDAILYLRQQRLYRWSTWPEWRLARILPAPGSDVRLTDRVYALAFSPDGRWLVSGGGEPARSSDLRLWNVADGSLVRDLGQPHSDVVFAAAFSPDGRVLATAGADRFVRLLDPLTGRVLRNLEGHTQHVLAVAWSADGRTLASGGAEGVVKLWNSATGERLRNVEGFGKEVVGLYPLGVAPEFLATSGSGQARVFRPDGSQVRTLPAGNAFLQTLAVTADGRTALAGDDRGIVRVWSVADGKSLAELPPPATSTSSAKR